VSLSRFLDFLSSCRGDIENIPSCMQLLEKGRHSCRCNFCFEIGLFTYFLCARHSTSTVLRCRGFRVPGLCFVIVSKVGDNEEHGIQ